MSEKIRLPQPEIVRAMQNNDIKRAQIYGQLLSRQLSLAGRPVDSSDPRFHQLARLIELGLVNL